MMDTRQQIHWWLATVVAAAVLATSLQAQESTPSGRASGTRPVQEPLRWKLNLGEKLDYHLVEEMTLTTRGEPLEETNTPLHQEMDMTWTVVGVNDAGEAVIEQKFRNVKLKMTGPRGEKIEYQSGGDEATASLAAMVAPIYEALTKGEFEFTMTARGEIKDVKVAEEVLEAMKNSPGAALLGDVATAEGLQRMITKWALVLPEKAPQPGETSRSRVEIEAGGEVQVVESSYRYEGTKDIDGRTFAVFRPGLEITIRSEKGSPTKVKEQNSKGEILFDIAAGRLQSAKLERGVTMDVTVGTHRVEQNVKQTVEVRRVE
jgi:hypothetical protein